MIINETLNITALSKAPVAIVGYGSQGRAHALNLRDSGLQVLVGARPGGQAETRAKADGFEVLTVRDASERARLVALLTPDMSHRTVFEQDIAPSLKDGDALLVAHGFSLLYGEIKPPENIDVLLVAPKSPGDLVRREYENGRGVPCLFATASDATGQARDRAIAYASGLGGARAGLIETTIKEETETDLFGEQAVLCGGVTELITAGFDTLVEAGYQPETAYFECLHELKLIVDLLYEGGLAKMHAFISETAAYGDLTVGPKIVDERVRETMRNVLTDVQSGQFARDWIEENRTGKANYEQQLTADLAHPIESIGQTLRARMSWTSETRTKSGGAP